MTNEEIVRELKSIREGVRQLSHDFRDSLSVPTLQHGRLVKQIQKLEREIQETAE